MFRWSSKVKDAHCAITSIGAVSGGVLGFMGSMKSGQYYDFSRRDVLVEGSLNAILGAVVFGVIAATFPISVPLIAIDHYSKHRK
jgi:nitrogen fixation-related uncharacterized protein